MIYFLFSFKDDDPITGGADGRDHIQRFLSQRHKKLPWKLEVTRLVLFSFSVM